jgi:hypothetical protein
MNARALELCHIEAFGEYAFEAAFQEMANRKLFFGNSLQLSLQLSFRRFRSRAGHLASLKDHPECLIV